MISFKSPKFSNFMLNPSLSVPSHYDKDKFLLLSYSLPLLKYCFVICTQSEANLKEFSPIDLEFIQTEAQRLSLQSVGKPDNFMLIFSGQAMRRRQNAHVHIFIIENRWEKTLVYTFLATKNLALSTLNSILVRK